MTHEDEARRTQEQQDVIEYIKKMEQQNKALASMLDKDWMIYNPVDKAFWKIIDARKGISEDNLEPVLMAPGLHLIEDKLEFMMVDELGNISFRSMYSFLHMFDVMGARVYDPLKDS